MVISCITKVLSSEHWTCCLLHQKLRSIQAAKLCHCSDLGQQAQSKRNTLSPKEKLFKPREATRCYREKTLFCSFFQISWTEHSQIGRNFDNFHLQCMLFELYYRHLLEVRKCLVVSVSNMKW